MAKPRFRYAPSPTGHLHLGNFATATLAYLQARQLNGTFLLRIEDVDTQRSRPEYTSDILQDLEWLGIEWDEEPVYQSQRSELYDNALEILLQKGMTYPCFCSRNDLKALASAPHGISSEGPDYPGFCRDLSPAERESHASERDPAIRFKLPHKSYSFTDLIRGECAFPPGWGGDFVVRRSDGMWAYQLACTVDDLDMGITHVLRGADLIDSTPRQLALIEALGGTAPQYAHTPLWMGTDGHRLSKRHGDVSLQDYRESGKSPEELLGWMTFYSGLKESKTPVSMNELLDSFDLSKVSKEDITVDFI